MFQYAHFGLLLGQSEVPIVLLDSKKIFKAEMNKQLQTGALFHKDVRTNESFIMCHDDNYIKPYFFSRLVVLLDR